MQKSIYVLFFLFVLGMASCNTSTESEKNVSTETENVVGQSGVKDDISNPNVVQVAIGSKDHTTLVTAVKTAELVDALSNAGPFTVFAPTNAAFEALPPGTVEDLLKPENKEKLTTILQYHVYVGVINTDLMQDGQSLGMVDGGNVTISKKENKLFVNGNAEIVGSVKASNGVVHVINSVLLPK
ncbi:MAG TPA: fasciclin domain-containing protein [Chitinophagaceae bacterium]|jgi:uncharacterized surface protein with fasciclin (FAS1) repeats|nr:fasciclin domain-containing protein [Chitinophagaceae bacterium]